MYENFINDVSTKVIETRDEFIFQTISSWIVNNHQITVSKETLSKAVALVKMIAELIFAKLQSTRRFYMMSTCVDTKKVIERVAM